MIIGMYDSGIGGLTVVKEVIRKIPNANIIYVADNYNVPYGDKPEEVIKNFSCEIADFLFHEGAETIAIACNMSSAVSLSALKDKHIKNNIYGTIEFGAKEALKNSKRIGVLATVGTVNSHAYKNTILSYNKEAYIHEEPCPEFVPIVENHLYHTQKAFDVVKYRIENILNKGDIGALVLGCTHYPYLIDNIKKILPTHIKIINPAVAMADFLAKKNIYSNNTFSFKCYATNDSENVSKVCENLLGFNTKCQLINWTKEGKLTK